MTRRISRAVTPVLSGGSVLAALVALALTAAPIFAVGPGDGPGPTPGPGPGPVQPPTPPPVTPGDVPEINPGAAVGALVLLVGGTLLLTDRLRRRNSPQPDRIA
jgi:hypothetical protein